jgi:hypothetical protein
MKCGIYQHYKGGYYQILGVAEHTETSEMMVVYISLDAGQPGPRIRVRPLHGPEGFETPTANGNLRRFIYIGDSVT